MELTAAVGPMTWEQLQDSPVVLDLIRSWATWLFQGGGGSGGGSGGGGAADGIGSERLRVVWERRHVWGGLRTVVTDVLAPCALEAAALEVPELLAAALAAAASPPPGGGGGGGGAPPRERTHALQCLAAILPVLKGAAWAGSSGGDGCAPPPGRVIEACCAATWAHVGDVILLKAIAEALPRVALSAAAAADEGALPRADADAAFAAAARHLVLTLPGSSAPPLVQGLALEAGLSLVASAGAGPRAATADLWAWRAAAAAGAPGAARSAGGVGVGVAGLPGSMGERVEEAAADLLVAALQVGAWGGAARVGLRLPGPHQSLQRLRFALGPLNHPTPALPPPRVQADATALAAALARGAYAPPGAAPAGPCAPGLLLSADEAAAAAAGGEEQEGDRHQARCIPGVWALLEGVEHPKVSAALLAAAAHAAPAATPPPPGAGLLPPRVPPPDEAARGAGGGGGGDDAGAAGTCAVGIDGDAAWLGQLLMQAAGEARRGAGLAAGDLNWVVGWCTPA
jgi:hypothetical protein